MAVIKQTMASVKQTMATVRQTNGYCQTIHKWYNTTTDLVIGEIKEIHTLLIPGLENGGNNTI